MISNSVKLTWPYNGSPFTYGQDCPEGPLKMTNASVDSEEILVSTFVDSELTVVNLEISQSRNQRNA
jgi:hypothetical protein